MKKSILLTSFIIALSAIFMVSCSKDDESKGAASIKFDQTNIEIVAGKLTVTGKVYHTSAEATIESIKAVCVYSDGTQTSEADIADIKSTEFTKKSNNEYTFRFDETTKGIKDHLNNIKSIKITVTVKDGDTSTNAITVETKTVEPTGNLDAAATFKWERIAGGNATLTPSFGLTWTRNLSKATYAYINKGTTTKFVELPNDAWTTIKTKEDLKKAIDGATAITSDFKGISVDATANYTKSLGVLNAGVYYIIYVEKCTVTNKTTSVDVAITGNYKK